ncbi:MAG: sigma-70 family RNA polymerase sigma factor [Candidatus Hydrogenedentota bacterium]
MSEAVELSLLMDDFMVESKDSKSYAELREADDQTLTGDARTGDYAAFEELVRRYRNDVYGLAYHYVRNREDAWDISQEVFIKAHRAIGSFRGDSSFKTWILRITANRCKDFFKKRKLKTISLDDSMPEARFESVAARPDESMASSELGQRITQALDTLSDKHKTAFVLRELEGLSYENMAEVMKCSLGTVMSRLHHARKKLQQTLLDMGVMEDR